MQVMLLQRAIIENALFSPSYVPSLGIINNLINEIKRLGFSFSLILRKRGWEWATGAEQHSPAGCKRYPWSRNVASGTGWGSRWWHPWVTSKRVAAEDLCFFFSKRGRLSLSCFARDASSHQTQKSESRRVGLRWWLCQAWHCPDQTC